ncbi:hypothetical protein ACVMH6_000945 [Rhizobium leguminosarum]
MHAQVISMHGIGTGRRDRVSSEEQMTYKFLQMAGEAGN